MRPETISFLKNVSYDCLCLIPGVNFIAGGVEIKICHSRQKKAEKIQKISDIFRNMEEMKEQANTAITVVQTKTKIPSSSGIFHKETQTLNPHKLNLVYKSCEERDNFYNNKRIPLNDRLSVAQFWLEVGSDVAVSNTGAFPSDKELETFLKNSKEQDLFKKTHRFNFFGKEWQFNGKTYGYLHLFPVIGTIVTLALHIFEFCSKKPEPIPASV